MTAKPAKYIKSKLKPEIIKDIFPPYKESKVSFNIRTSPCGTYCSSQCQYFYIDSWDRYDTYNCELFGDYLANNKDTNVDCVCRSYDCKENEPAA